MSNTSQSSGSVSDHDSEFEDTISPYVEPVVPPATTATFYQPIPKQEPRARLINAFEVARNLYKYTPLQNDEIRLLKLLPKLAGKELRCKVLVKSLAKARRLGYHALSYHWGAKPTDPRPFRVEVVPDVTSFADAAMAASRVKYITLHRNLHNALSHLAPKEGSTGSMILWADAICMNQDSKEEKTKQVKRMAEIYNSASSVVVWLGPGDATTEKALSFVEEIVVLNNFDSLISNERSVDGWEALTKLMTIEWFSRRWVVQEIALARRATLRCGDKAINWQDFADAVLLFLAKLPMIRDLFKLPRKLPSIEGLGAVDLVRVVSNLARKTEQGYIQEHLVDLEILVSSLIGFEVTTRHDAIYAYLSLARDAVQRHGGNNLPDTYNALQIEVDYDRPVMEVFVDFTRKCIFNSGSIDIICRHWAPGVDHDSKRPSWIKDIKHSAHGTAQTALLGSQARRNGNSLVGAPYRDSRKIYNASGNCKSFNNLRYRVSNGDNPDSLESSGSGDQNAVLVVRGFKLGVISKLSNRVIRGIVDRDWLRHGGWNETAKQSRAVPDKLWRTLVADRDENGDNPPGWYGRACYQGLTDDKITGGGQDLETRPENVEAQQPLATMLLQYLQRVREVVWNRKFFLAQRYCQNCAEAGRDNQHDYVTCPFSEETAELDSTDASPAGEGQLPMQNGHHDGVQPDTEDSLFGLGPGETDDGDFICILAGCSVPVILRKLLAGEPSSGGPPKEYYQLVGEAFVYGKMDGEAVSAVDQKTLNKKFVSFDLK